MPMLRTPVVDEDIRWVLKACQKELCNLSGKTLLLTGGSGFVGSYLVESILLFNQSAAITPCRLLLPTRSLSDTKAKWPHFFGHEHLVWFEWDSLSLTPPSTSCDYIIHAASPADPASYLHAPMQTMEDIAAATSAVLHYAQQAKVQTLLYLSSGAAYGKQPAELDAMSESYCGAPDVNDRSSCYGEAKRYSELLCRSSGVPSITARLFAFIGPYQDMNGSFAAPDFIRQATKAGTIRIHGDGTAMRSYCYASDLTIGLWKLLINGKPGELYNVGVDEPCLSIHELATLIANQCGNVQVIVEGRSNNGQRSRYIPNTDKFKHIYTPKISLGEALKRTRASYQFAYT